MGQQQDHERDDLSLTAKPSQAEGDRQTVEADLGEGGDAELRKRPLGESDAQSSQAEGDRATVEADLREKGRE